MVAVLAGGLAVRQEQSLGVLCPDSVDLNIVSRHSFGDRLRPAGEGIAVLDGVGGRSDLLAPVKGDVLYQAVILVKQAEGGVFLGFGIGIYPEPVGDILTAADTHLIAACFGKGNKTVLGEGDALVIKSLPNERYPGIP